MGATEIEFLLVSSDATWSHEKWQQLPDDGYRYEIIDGVLYKSTVPSFRHQRSVAHLVQSVGAPLEEVGVAITIIALLPVFMAGADPVQPDFMLIRRERAAIIADDGFVRGVPDLIAEVLSPNIPELDTVIKRAVYARAGVPEYWILRPTSRDVLVCWHPDAELSDYAETRLFAADTDLVSPTLPIRVAVGSLFEPQTPPA